MKYQGIIFDLDGVLCFTDQYHYIAWKTIADEEKIPFDEKINNRLRGVSRMESLEIILEMAKKEYSLEEKKQLAEKKNDIYKRLLDNMTPKDVSKEVRETLRGLKEKGIRIAIGSSSKNARKILENTGLIGMFDGIADGTVITHSKPHPEVFLKAARLLGLYPQECLVVEDARAGIEAAVSGGFASAGLGEASKDARASYSLKSIKELLEIENPGSQVYDLRSALELLKEIPGQYIETDVEVDPMGELAGIYRYVGAGGTVQRPTREGPAMVFNRIKGHEGARVAIGLLASRKRVGALLGCPPEQLGFLLKESVSHPVKPVVIPGERASCQEVVHYADEEGFDIRKLLPAPTNTPEDAGPYITMGMCYASNPRTGESDVTIHRLCLQSKDELSIFLQPGARHIGYFRELAEKEGRPLPISVSIGVDPAIEIASCFEPPTTPLGYDELQAAGAIRSKPVELVQCLTIPEKAIANAEYVIEGEILPDIRMREDFHSNTGKAMPEFPGYCGPANPRLPVIRVKAVTTRKNPIMQTCIGPSEEHVSMAGIPTEASILDMVEKAMPGKCKNVYNASFGGGKYVTIMQFQKKVPSDEGRQRQAALLAFAAFAELKHVILVDEDVDIFDIRDVMWAMTTRFQADTDLVMIPGVQCHPLDPSNHPVYHGAIRAEGIACKAIFDCTVPFAQKRRFVRAQFQEPDKRKWKELLEP